MPHQTGKNQPVKSQVVVQLLTEYIDTSKWTKFIRVNKIAQDWASKYNNPFKSLCYDYRPKTNSSFNFQFSTDNFDLKP